MFFKSKTWNDGAETLTLEIPWDNLENVTPEQFEYIFWR